LLSDLQNIPAVEARCCQMLRKLLLLSAHELDHRQASLRMQFIEGVTSGHKGQ
jgi:hypothetical protein